jgi:hypothetical protein
MIGMHDISLQERRLYALFVSGFTGQKAYLFCASGSSGAAVDYDKLSQAVRRGIRPIRHLRANRRLSAGPATLARLESVQLGLASDPGR